MSSKGFAVLLVMGVVTSSCKKKEMSGSEFVAKGQALRDSHRGALTKLCVPAFTKLTSELPPLVEDKITGVPALHAGNVAVFSEDQAARAMYRAKASASQRNVKGSTVFGDSYAGVHSPDLDEFAHLCTWLIEEHGPYGSPFPEGFDGGKQSWDVKADEKIANVTDGLTRFERVSYVVILRVVEFDAPAVTAQGLKPGHVKAEARILDNNGAERGGFRFEATSSSEVAYSDTVDRKSGEVITDGKSSAVDDDLSKNTLLVFTATLAAKVPGSDFKLSR